jgi:hypothetical protein
MITQVAPLLIAVQHPMTVIHHLTVVQQQIDTVKVVEKKIAIEATTVVVEILKTTMVVVVVETMVIRRKLSLFLQVINH